MFEKKGETRLCRECGKGNCNFLLPIRTRRDAPCKEGRNFPPINLNSASGKGFFGNWGCWIPKGCLEVEDEHGVSEPGK
jgi:hypothetical protein